MPAVPAESAQRLRAIAVCVFLAAVTVAVYLQTGNHDFVSYDDVDYVTRNEQVLRGVSLDTVRWAFTSVEFCNWHPLTWLSHMLDVEMFGKNAGGHHLTSVVIHAASSILLLWLLLGMTGSLWRSAFVAALFALHPLHVESVAWVAERKDVLSAFFLFLTLLLYARYAKGGGRGPYLLSLASFVLGLMSKPMLVTTPLLMLLLDFWPLRRVEGEGGWRGILSRFLPLLREKVPFFACSLASGLMTIYAQRAAMSDLQLVPFADRLQNALIAYVAYVLKTVWPTRLAVLYPLPPEFPLWQGIGSLVLLLGASAAAVVFARRFPFLPVGWFWFLISLVPVIGIIQVGSQSMADRYTYIPHVGLFVLAAWGIPELLGRLPRRELVLGIAGAAAVAASAALAWKQAGYWKNSITLYTRTLEVTSGNAYIHNNLGLELSDRGEIERAIHHYEESLRINPGDADAYYNYGNALLKKGDLDGAMAKYLIALSVKPNDSNAHNNLAVMYAKKGDLAAALDEFREAVRLDPKNAKAQKGIQRVLRVMSGMPKPSPSAPGK